MTDQERIKALEARIAALEAQNEALVSIWTAWVRMENEANCAGAIKAARVRSKFRERLGWLCDAEDLVEIAAGLEDP